MGEKCPCPVLRYCPDIGLHFTGKTKKDVSRIARPRQYCNHVTQENKSDTILASLTLSVSQSFLRPLEYVLLYCII